MNIKNTKQKIHSYDKIDSPDYTAESIALSLTKNGVLPEQIILKSTGTSKRAHKKDTSISIESPTENQIDDLFFLESPREGIYDTLPESIFHSFSGKDVKNNYEIIEDIKKHREEEMHARLFFLPFEQEFFNIRVILLSFENSFELSSGTSSLINIYKNYYPVLNDLSEKKAYLFLRLIPLIHELRDDFEKVEKCLTMLLDADVRISISFNNNLDAYIPTQLGSSMLGVNTIIGNCIEDGEPDLDITLNPHTSEINNYNYYFFERTGNLAKQLCDFFIGAQYEISISYISNSKESTLSRSFLGYNVYL